MKERALRKQKRMYGNGMEVDAVHSDDSCEEETKGGPDIVRKQADGSFHKLQ